MDSTRFYGKASKLIMCGICGYINSDSYEPADPGVIEEMCSALYHRGPDEQGKLVEGQIGLGMRRLSIIDLATGQQPIHNEDKTIWVVLNGEIYNYRELRETLENKGHAFYTSSDTEVLVHLYEEYGEECVHHLRGMFAFAVWDNRERSLLLARDRMGEKPLHYYEDATGLIFASEIKSLLRHPRIQRRLNGQALISYLQYSYIPEPISAFDGIYKLRSGHVLVYRDGRSSVRQYWDLPSPRQDALSEEEYCEELVTRLQDAVKLQLVSDVPVGAFLSGGMDSSTVVALMAKMLDRPVKTFSIGFDKDKSNELPYARQVARYLGTEHYELVVRPAEVSLLESVVRYFDEPFGDASAIPTYHVARIARDHVKVALSGDGGDEIFAGYDRYAVMMGRQWVRRISPSIGAVSFRWVSTLLPERAPGKRWLYNLSLAPYEQYMDNITYIGKAVLVALLTDDFMEGTMRGNGSNAVTENSQYWSADRRGDLLSWLQYYDAKVYLPSDVLTKVDRMTMAHSLESRAPLLDHRLVEFMAAMPGGMKLRNKRTKYILKRVAARWLPQEVLSRPKQGFAPSWSYWFQGDIEGYLEGVLSDSKAVAQGILRKETVDALLRDLRNPKGDVSVILWLVLVFELWYRQYLGQPVTALTT